MFEQESALLESRGHTVVRVEVSNEEVAELSTPRLAAATIWNRDAARRVGEAVERSGATIAHFHNTFPLISPAAYYAARSAGAAVVQTLHNYRLICPGALLLRDGKPCEACVGSKVAWRGVVHGCYRGSRVQSAGVAGMVALHRAAGTWHNAVDLYLALSDFSRDRFTAGALPADRVRVRPNHLMDDPGIGSHDGGFALFVGRVNEQKGVRVLVEAWRRLDQPVPLRIIGDVDDAEFVRDVGTAPGIEWVGGVPREEVLRSMQDARLLVLPSISYENCPMAVPEAFATGLPVIASRTGPLPSMVSEGRTGLLFERGSAGALAGSVRRLWSDRDRLGAMGAAARAEYESRYTATHCHESLMKAYRTARERYEGSHD